MKREISFLVAIFIFVSCHQQQSVDTKAEGEKLMQLSRDWSQAAANRNVEKILSYWSDDAVVIAGGDPVISGKQGIRQMVEGSFKNPGFQIGWEPQTVEIAKSGDLGYLLENTQITVNDSTGKPVVSRFKGITIWKKQDNGTWKNVVDILSPLPPEKK
jgi:uncharacterized protein (TIGR02246 family)